MEEAEFESFSSQRNKSNSCTGGMHDDTPSSPLLSYSHVIQPPSLFPLDPLSNVEELKFNFNLAVIPLLGCGPDDMESCGNTVQADRCDARP